EGGGEGARAPRRARQRRAAGADPHGDDRGHAPRGMGLEDGRDPHGARRRARGGRQGRAVPRVRPCQLPDGHGDRDHRRPGHVTVGLPLEGYLVVTLEQAVSAPLATRHLADLGARVIKIERPGSGDFARQYDDYVKGMATYFVWLNRNKESVTLDTKDPRGR